MNAIRMIRSFHPVGHGAFYSEKFYGLPMRRCFTVVYDCGTSMPHASIRSNKVVENALNDCDCIDVLFISHFDSDHVSLIEDLIAKISIRNVVLPLLHPEEFAVLSAHYQVSRQSLSYEILTNPTQFFGGKTAVVRVRPSNDEQSLNALNETPNQFDSDERDIVIVDLNGQTVRPILGQVVDVSSFAVMHVPMLHWCYISYNHAYDERHKKLLELLEQNQIRSNCLPSPEYVLSKLHELNKAYRSLRKLRCGSINENSMIVYSGPDSRQPMQNCELVDWMHHCWLGPSITGLAAHRVGCIYSGDSDFNKVKIRKKFQDVWDSVGIVQIPHHGSFRSFSIDFLQRDSTLLCPISERIPPRYRSSLGKVIDQLFFSNSIPILVHEAPCSRFAQLISIKQYNAPHNSGHGLTGNFL